MTTTALLEQYRIADFLEWQKRKQLVLNPAFQRRSVWNTPARVMLIDSILRRLPIPKIYIRTKIDPVARTAVREVVDGQQRLRAIIEFSEDMFALTPRTKEFRSLTYSTMSAELQEAFLTYPLAVDQLVNASDTDVLEVFWRLNSYNVKLVPAELRHSRYASQFSWAVHDAALEWSVLWDVYRTVGRAERLRMADDELTAEMFGVILQGVRDGGASNIDKLYKLYLDDDFPAEDRTRQVLDGTLQFLTRNFDSLLRNTALGRRPHFLMLFAATVQALHGIPPGDLNFELPESPGEEAVDIRRAREELTRLASVLEEDEPPGSYEAFWLASRQTTQRIASRRTRFAAYLSALVG